jgi:hypothetical protein
MFSNVDYVLLAVGAFLLMAPHSMHNKVFMTEAVPHMVHMTSGALMIAYVLYANQMLPFISQ